jgi:hypothetical protein
MATTTNWQPSWWDDSHGSAWERVKEAMRRDWEQTKKDLQLPNGHELNQGVMDTIKQAMGSEPIPAADGPNPPKVVGSWDEAEVPMGYGYTAKTKYGAEHPTWNEGIELRLRSEWEAGHPGETQKAWPEVGPLVRRGYEYNPKA